LFPNPINHLINSFKIHFSFSNNKTNHFLSPWVSSIVLHHLAGEDDGAVPAIFSGVRVSRQSPPSSTSLSLAPDMAEFLEVLTNILKKTFRRRNTSSTEKNPPGSGQEAALGSLAYINKNSTRKVLLNFGDLMSANVYNAAYGCIVL
jgi:hypothetical protein